MKMEMKKESYEKPSLTGVVIDRPEGGIDDNISGGYGFGTRSRGGFDNRLDNGF